MDAVVVIDRSREPLRADLRDLLPAYYFTRLIFQNTEFVEGVLDLISS